MKTMIKLITFVMILSLLMPGIHGDAYSIHSFDSVDMSAFVFEFPGDPDILEINDPHNYANDYVANLVSTQYFPISQNNAGFTLNGLNYEFETYVKTQGNVDVPAFTAIDELDPARIQAYISAAQMYPGVEILGNPTGDYNCHSYAWYMESTNNPFWIVNVETYAYDAHTESREKTEVPQPGDICVYLKDGQMVHSAVIDHIEGDTIICRSKWGPSVLCEHPIGSVPADYWASSAGIICYILKITPHEWVYEYAGANRHTRTCTICDYEETLSCDYTYTYLYDDTHNASCKYCNNSYYGVVCTFSYSSNADETHTRVCDVCGNTQTTSCNLQYSNINNTRHSVSCAECDYYVASQLCSVAYTSNGNKTHTGSCVKCENTFSGSCSIAYSYLSADQHRGSCNKCDYAHTAACDYMTTYCGNSAVGDVHTKQCQACGHTSGSATTACSFIFRGNGNNTHSQICTQCLYVKSGPDPCLFKTGDTCHFCGALKDSAVINQLEQEELPE